MLMIRMIGPMPRLGLACVLAGAVASVPPSVLAACPGSVPFAVSRFASDVELEVRVTREIVDAAELERWIDEEGRRVLDGLPDEPARNGSLRVEIGGSLYDYQVTITPLRDGLVMGMPSTWECECSNEDLLEKLRAALPEVVRVLAVEEEPEPPPEPVISSSVETVDDGQGRRRERLGPGGAAGVALMAVGVAGVGAGVTLMELRDVIVPDAGAKLSNANLQPPGALIAGTSLGIVVAGFALYLLRDRTGQRRRAGVAAVGPAFDGAGRWSLMVNGRF